MKRSTLKGQRRLPLATFVLALALAAPGLSLTAPPAAAMGAGGSEPVRTLYNTLLYTMRNGPALGAHGRFAQIEPTVRRVFDIPFMSRLAVGPEWATLSEAQRQQVSQAFERYVAAIYAERFDSYSGERLQVTGEQPTGAGVIITSQIVKSNGEPVNINYLMRQNGGAWQIADVYLDGTISELATRRSEFAAILRSRGINGLIETLNAKANTLVMARTS
ncbi:MAG: ABC transporter substrate-binding protein [Thiohalocapsa sp.]